MTHSYMWHDTFIYVTWLIHICDMTHSYVRHASFTCKIWPVYMWDMTRSNERHDSFKWETRLVQMRDMTRSNERHDSFICRRCGHSWLRRDQKTKHNQQNQTQPLRTKTYTQDIHDTHAKLHSHTLSWVAAAGRADRAARRTLVQAHAHTQAHTHTYTHKQIQTHTQAHTHTHT